MNQAPSDERSEQATAERSIGDDPVWMWAVAGIVLFAAAAAFAYRPSMANAQDVALALLPWLTMAAVTLLFLEWRISIRPIVKAGAIVVVLGGWTILVHQDSNWSIAGVAIYAVCFFACSDLGVGVGVALVVVASVAWASAYIVDDAPNWLIVGPFIALVASTTLALQIDGAERRNARQAELIDQLHQAQRDLAAAERSKGALEERARMAGEIHDTLAQGLTSIVLVSRAGQRSASPQAALATIEESAQENLDAARRLVDAISPTELDTASLADALRRHAASSLPPDVDTAFHVVGDQRPLPGDVEVTVLRAAQEALANVSAHADADRVDVTLSYFDDAVALDVSDDGVGLAGRVNDRGTLTGGQGLDALRRRARSLAGELTIESDDGGGAVLSLQLPVDRR